MAGQEADGVAHALADLARAAFVIEEGDVLLPGQADHDAQAILPRNVEQPARRRCIGANGVQPVGGDQGKVALHARAIVKFVAVFVRFKRSVGNALHPEFLSGIEKKLTKSNGSLEMGHGNQELPC